MAGLDRFRLVGAEECMSECQGYDFLVGPEKLGVRAGERGYGERNVAYLAAHIQPIFRAYRLVEVDPELAG